MVRLTHAATVASLIAGFSIAACSSSSASGFASGDVAGAAGSDAGASTPGFGGGASDAAPPPEKKIEGSYQSPVATGSYVWVANPQSGRVAFIRADTLDVNTILAGDGPTYLAAVPDATGDSALVLNVLSQDATLLRADKSGALSTKTFPMAANVNAWAVSANGRWAIAWADVSKATKPDITQGFQDLSVIDLTGRTATILAVGYRPVKVAFSADATRAFAVTQDGISVLDLTGAAPVVVANYATSDDPLTDVGTHDVSFTPDGGYGLVRRDAQATITIVALSDGKRTTVTLPAAATDLTLSPSGDRAVVAMRDVGKVAILPIPAIATDPLAFTTVAITGQTVGRAIVTAPGTTALLFTTIAQATAESLTILTFGPPATFRTERLYAPVLGVFPTNDAKSAIVLHDVTGQATSAHGAFSLVPIGLALPAKIVSTTAKPNAVAISPSSDRAIVTVRDDSTQTYGAYLAKMPSFEVDPYVLASPPLAAGVVVGANRAFIAQDHPEGRITFIDLATGEARTLTGFELGARVVSGSPR